MPMSLCFRPPATLGQLASRLVAIRVKSGLVVYEGDAFEVVR